MRTKHRLFSILICCLAVSTLLSACSLTPFDSHTAETTVSASSETEATTLVAPTPDEVPVDLNGYAWSLRAPWAGKLLPGNSETAAAQRLRDLYAELEELYHVDISLSGFSSADFLAAFASGVKYADVIGLKTAEIPVMAANHAIYSVEDPILLNAGLNYNDRTRFWPNASALMRYAGKQWSVQIATSYNLPAPGCVVLCNGSLLDKLGTGNLYNLLKTGKWTFEQYQRIAVAANRLTNLENVYGTGIQAPRTVFHALGGQFVSAEGRWKSELSNAASVTAANLLTELTSPEKYALSASFSNLHAAFADDQLLFLWVNLNTLLSTPSLASISDLHIMPVPSVGNVRTTPLGEYTGYAFPAQNTAPASTVAVFNAFALRLNENWITQLANLADLDENEIDAIANYVLPTLTASAADFEPRLVSFFAENIANPLLARTERPEAVLKAAEPLLAALIKEVPAPTLIGR